MSIKNGIIPVKERKLGREKAVGLSYSPKISGTKTLIEIDPRQSSKQYFSTLLHELLHEIFPDMEHKDIYRAEKILANTLWKENYRKVNQ